jgi:amidase
MSELALRPAREILAALRAEKVSSRELLERYLARVEQLGPRVNAVVTLDADGARKRADAADAARARGESLGPLHGLPITVKDCFETAGLRTTAGARELAGHVPARNAVAVQRLLDAGAVLFGKTNTPAWAMDWQTYNELFGTTSNPWDAARTPGGSSGGSAAALAAGLSGLELGSDIGGSIRIPAHFCGLFGHKPSWGIVPQRGHIPGLPGSLVEQDINVVGPLARGAADLALALDVLAGPLADHARAWRLSLPPPRHSRAADWRVAAWFDDPDFPVDASVREILEGAASALRRAGVRVDERARPAFSLAQAVDLFRRLLAAVTSETLPDAVFARLVAGAEGGEEEGALAAFGRALGMRHREWLRLHQERQQLRAQWADFFRDVDLLLCPVSPLPALRHDQSDPMLLRTIQVNGATRSYMDHFAWMGPVGVAWLPASVAPLGRTPEGLPVGLQIVAPQFEDRSAIAFAGLVEETLGGFQVPPGFDGPGGVR